MLRNVGYVPSSASVTLAVGTLLAASIPTGLAQSPAGPNTTYIGKPITGCGTVVLTRIDSPPNTMAAIAVPAQVGPVHKDSVPVTNTPYSIVGTSQTVQVLADGNRIVRTSTTRYYRDSSGRTRTEYSVSGIGGRSDETHTFVNIHDPVARRILNLHPETKRAEAIDLPARQVGFITGAGSGSRPSVNIEGAFGTAISSAPPSGCSPRSHPVPEETQLGKRMIRGLEATGTRTEYTIPAGEIGNEQPITVRSEQWFSADLGVILASTHHDPSVGDTTYTVDQLDRSEPDPALFTLPSDYTVQDLPAMVTPVKVLTPTRESSSTNSIQREPR